MSERTVMSSPSVRRQRLWLQLRRTDMLGLFGLIRFGHSALCRRLKLRRGFIGRSEVAQLMLLRRSTPLASYL
jgi:hypothetical protein